MNDAAALYSGSTLLVYRVQALLLFVMLQLSDCICIFGCFASEYCGKIVHVIRTIKDNYAVPSYYLFFISRFTVNIVIIFFKSSSEANLQIVTHLLSMFAFISQMLISLLFSVRTSYLCLNILSNL